MTCWWLISFALTTKTLTTRGITVHVFVPNHLVQGVPFSSELPQFGTPYDPNNYGIVWRVRIVYLCLTLLLTRTKQKFYSVHFTWNVLAVHQLLSMSCSMLVGLAWLGGLVKLSRQCFVWNCMPTLFNWSQICLWIHFKRWICNCITCMCRLAESEIKTDRKASPSPHSFRQPLTADLDRAKVITNAVEHLLLQIYDHTQS